eukprot:TRINITY_DN2911_c0_g2_i1.p2 TRINITY_DN2911_c0_g2~~TRINITY_DN2911_c0_g2_i1.p2  ORF type:complete len:167 (+),score=76.12 TRINITY_DN2911_c0_g2_i1:645-1145(+)
MREPERLELTLRLCPDAVAQLLRAGEPSAGGRVLKLSRPDPSQPLGLMWCADGAVLLLAFSGPGAAAADLVGHRLTAVDGRAVLAPRDVAALTAGKADVELTFSAEPEWEHAASAAALTAQQRSSLRAAAKAGVAADAFAEQCQRTPSVRWPSVEPADVCRVLAMM